VNWYFLETAVSEYHSRTHLLFIIQCIYITKKFHQEKHIYANTFIPQYHKPYQQKQSKFMFMLVIQNNVFIIRKF